MNKQEAEMIYQGLRKIVLSAYKSKAQMGTEVWYTKDSSIHAAVHSELIGYCLSSPLDAFKVLYKGYRIHLYKDILLPVDRFHIQSGLILKELNRVPQGAIIVARNANDLDLEFARESSLRSEEQYFDALKNAIERTMLIYNRDDDGLESANYLELRLIEKKYFHEKLLTQLLEIASVTLDLKKPTVNDLKFILEY